MLPLLFKSIFYHHLLPLLRLWKNSKSALWSSWYPGYGGNMFVCVTLLTWPTQVLNLFGGVREEKIYKKCTKNGTKNWGWCWNIGKNTHLLVIMRMRLLQIFLYIWLDELYPIQKSKQLEICTKSVRYYWGMRLMLHMRYIHYMNTNVDLLARTPGAL